ncbi:MAG: PIG-L family deacetylase [Anaerolineales bacterium]|nr:PIG-L family deacetylase [Anaerolineales bacterium]
MCTLVFVGAHLHDESFGPGGALAEYALRGVRVVYVCATRGKAGAADPEHLTGHATPGDMRWAELTTATRELGLAKIICLGYRGSGILGAYPPATDDSKGCGEKASNCANEREC